MPLTRSTSMQLAALSILSIMAGALLQVAPVVLIGAGPETDGFYIAQVVPLFLSSVPMSIVGNNLVPILAGMQGPVGAGLARAKAKQLLLPTILGGLALAITASTWLPLLFDLEGQDRLHSTLLLVYAFCAIAAINTVGMVPIAHAQTRGRFRSLELLQLCSTGLALLVMPSVLSAWGMTGFAGLLVMRALAVLLITSAWMLRTPHRRPMPGDLPFWRNAKAIASASVLVKVAPIIDRILASFASAGTVTTLGVGQQVVTALCTVNDKVLSRPLLVLGGSLASGRESCVVIAPYRRCLRLVGAASASLIALVAAIPILLEVWPTLGRVVERIGEPEILLGSVLVAVPTAFGQIASAAQHARGRGGFVSKVVSMSFLLSTSVKLAGFPYWGAMAIIAGSGLHQALSFWVLHRDLMQMPRPSGRGSGSTPGPGSSGGGDG